MKAKNSIFLFLMVLTITNSIGQGPASGEFWTVIEGNGIKVHTYMSPRAAFANTSHIIELEEELVLVDGQFFLPYANELKSYTEALGKQVSRLYISHGHPDHYLGFGDTFTNVPVYALEETKKAIEVQGPTALNQNQTQFGNLIAKNLRIPTEIQKPGKETISGVDFIFEESFNNESEASLIIKIPSLGVYIAQDIVYNQIHLFISEDISGWADALKKILSEKDYPIILSGHGKEGGRALIKKNLEYLAFIEKAIKSSNTKWEYKRKIMGHFADYAGEGLIDLYLNYYLTPPNWK